MPELDFNNRGVIAFHLGNTPVYIYETVFNTWIIMAVLIILAIIARIMISKFKDVPTGLQNVVETIVEMMSNFVNDTVGEKLSYLGYWFFSTFAFILASNWSALFGLRPPTGDWATTFCFAMNTFLLIHILGIANAKGKYFKSYVEPMPLFLPIHLIGELARPISLSFRLFGNILGGFIIMGIVYGLFPFFLKVGIPAALHIYFDMFAGSLQAFIFCILSMTFIKEKQCDEEE